MPRCRCKNTCIFQAQRCCPHLKNRIYVDATIEKECTNNELRELGKWWKYVIRIKDIDSSGLARKYHLPDAAFDKEVEIIITRKQTE